MKTQKISPVLWFWIICFTTFKQGMSYYTVNDDYFTSDRLEIVQNQLNYQNLIEETIQSDQNLYTYLEFVEPQIFISIIGFKVISEETSSVSWQLTTTRSNVDNLTYNIFLTKKNLKFFELNINFLIFEKNPYRRVVNGQTDFQQLINQQQPVNNILRISVPFPNKRGLSKFALIFITGVKLTQSFVGIQMPMSAKTEMFDEYYDIIFNMSSANQQYTVDTIFWNVLEYYQLPDENITFQDHSDGLIGYSYGSSDIIQGIVPLGYYEPSGIFLGIQSLFLKSATSGQVCGITGSIYNGESNISIYSCPGQVFDGTVNDCADNCQDGYYNFSGIPNRQVCIQCSYSCNTCSAEGDTNCTSCYPNYYFIEGQCKSTLDFTYCSSSNVCQFCNSQALNCLHCGPDLIECLECQPSFTLVEGKCISPSTNNKIIITSSMFSEEEIKSTSDVFNKISEGSTYTSAAMTFTSGFLRLSGYALLNQLLTTQKAFYLLLVSVNPPKFFYEFISALSDRGILNQFSPLNALSGIAESESNTIGDKFETERIPSDIFLNAGGGLMAVTIFGAVFGLFIVTENSRLHKIGMVLFEKLMCGVIVEIFQLSIFIFTFSLLICIQNSSEIDAVQIIIILICFILIITTLTGQAILLWRHGINTSSDVSKSIVKRVLIMKLLNECKHEKIQSRLYMVAFLTIECIVFPLIIVLCHQNSVSASFSMAAIQLFETGITFYIRPFVHFRETVLLLVEQVIFSSVFIAFTILTLQLQQVEDSTQSYSTSVDTTSLIISILVVGAVLLKPLFKLFRIIIILKDIFRARLAKARQNLVEKNLNKGEDLASNKVTIYPINSPIQEKQIDAMVVEHLELIDDELNVLSRERIESLQSPVSGIIHSVIKNSDQIIKSTTHFGSIETPIIIPS